MLQGESKFAPAGWHPVNRGADKSRAGACQVQRPSPFPRQIDNLAGGESQNVCALVPVPMLLINAFQPSHPVFEAKGVAVFEETLARRHNALVVGHGAT